MIDSILLYGTLGLMLAAALLTVVTDRLFTAVVYAGALSALAAFGYLLLGAPDVALAEAVIGSTLSTVIFLAALRKYRIFTIYLTGGAQDAAHQPVFDALVRALQRLEIEPHFVRTTVPAERLLTRPGCDLAAEVRDGKVILHGEQGSRPLACMEEALARAGLLDAVVFADSLTARVADYKEECR